MNDRFKFRVWNNKMQKFHIVFSMHGIVNDTLEGYAKDDNFVLEQCTGLKDKNDKLIYEGDIVEEWFGKTGTYQVIYENSTASFIFLNLNDEDYDYDLRQNPDLFPNQDLEIIGNIHENPELLEQNNDD